MSVRRWHICGLRYENTGPLFALTFHGYGICGIWRGFDSVFAWITPHD